MTENRNQLERMVERIFTWHEATLKQGRADATLYLSRPQHNAFMDYLEKYCRTGRGVTWTDKRFHEHPIEVRA